MARVALLLAVAAAALGLGAPRAVADVAWCGSGEPAANRVPDAVAGRLVHVIYAYPSDGVDGFAANASLIASVVAKTDAWWQAQDPGRTPRFDLYPFPDCSGFGSLDIGVVRLAATAAELAPSDRRFAQVAGLVPSDELGVKPVVFYDGAVDQPDLCGTAAGDASVGSRSLAVLYLRSTCMGSVDSDAAVFAHELTHELGYPNAPPHACPGDSGHVCDSSLDLMYPYLSADSIDRLTLDVGHDDYFDGLAASGWLRHLDAPQQPLALTIVGGGTVTSDLPGVACAGSCTTEWDDGTAVQLRAEPALWQRFVGWQGACSRDSCSLTLSAPTAVTAVFGPATVRLAARVSGRGTVTGAGISCPGRCSASVAAGAPLALRARPAKGWRFAGWTGACRGTSVVCRVTPQAAASVGARFSR